MWYRTNLSFYTSEQRNLEKQQLLLSKDWKSLEKDPWEGSLPYHISFRVSDGRGSCFKKCLCILVSSTSFFHFFFSLIFVLQLLFIFSPLLHYSILLIFQEVLLSSYFSPLLHFWRPLIVDVHSAFLGPCNLCDTFFFLFPSLLEISLRDLYLLYTSSLSHISYMYAQFNLKERYCCSNTFLS